MEALRAVLAEVRAIFGLAPEIKIPANLGPADVALCDELICSRILAEVRWALGTGEGGGEDG